MALLGNLLGILSIAVVTIFLIVRMRSKEALRDSPMASAGFDGFNEFFDPAAARAKELLDKKHAETVVLPAAEGDPLHSGEITIDLEK